MGIFDKLFGGTSEDKLIKTSRAGNLEEVKGLLEQGVDVNARDKTGQTALKEALCAGCDEMAKLLIEKGANIDAENEFDTDIAMLILLGLDPWVVDTRREAVKHERQELIQAIQKVIKPDSKEAIEFLIQALFTGLPKGPWEPIKHTET